MKKDWYIIEAVVFHQYARLHHQLWTLLSLLFLRDATLDIEPIHFPLPWLSEEGEYQLFFLECFSLWLLFVVFGGTKMPSWALRLLRLFGWRCSGGLWASYTDSTHFGSRCNLEMDALKWKLWKMREDEKIKKSFVKRCSMLHWIVYLSYICV